MSEIEYNRLRGQKPTCPRCALAGKIAVRCAPNVDRYYVFLQCEFCNQTGPGFENVNEAIIHWIKTTEALNATIETPEEESEPREFFLEQTEEKDAPQNETGLGTPKGLAVE